MKYKKGDIVVLETYGSESKTIKGTILQGISNYEGLGVDYYEVMPVDPVSTRFKTVWRTEGELK